MHRVVHARQHARWACSTRRPNAPQFARSWNRRSCRASTVWAWAPRTHGGSAAGSRRESAAMARHNSTTALDLTVLSPPPRATERDDNMPMAVDRKKARHEAATALDLKVLSRDLSARDRDGLRS